MKKKLFFKLFIFAVIGSLLTVTSCKDYDDDISGLNEEIAAAKSSLQSAVNELNTLKTQIAAKADQSAVSQAVATAKTEAINAALANATELINTLKGGYTGTMKDLNDDIVDIAALIEVLDGDIADLQEELDQAELLIALNAVAIALQQDVLDQYLLNVDSEDNVVVAIENIKIELAALGALVEINTEDIEAIMDEIEAIDVRLNVLNFNAKNMVTSVSLYAKTPNIPSTPWTPGISLSFSTAIQKANIFEDGIANAITFVEGAQVQTSASFVVRVSPTNAELTPGMISLQNSKGETYDNIEIVSVEPYNELLTRSTDGSGLWEVTVQLKEYDKDAFNAATTAKVSGATKKVLFAVAVNNTEAAEGEQARKAISEYDMELNYTKDVPVGVLSFKVDKTGVNDINNRFSFTSNESLTPKTQSGTPYAELKWKDSTKPAVEGTTDNTLADTDDRSTKAVFPAIQGKPMTITIDNDVRGVYVTLDKEANAIESAPSEYNAWKSYTIDKLNTVVEGKEIKITINHSTAINDFIGFRVYAVNHDGTLLDPDGKAFYVSVGNEPDAWPAVNTVVTPPTTDSKAVDVTLPKLAGATKIEWKTDKTEAVTGGPAATDPAFHVYFQEADGAGVFNTVSKVVPSDFSKVKKIVAVPTQANWLSYKDNKVYKGTLTIKNATGHVLTTMEITMKKELPTAPAGFSVKTNQIGEDGIYRSYLQPDTWTAPNATLGTMPLAQVFNWGTGTIGQFETTFAASQPKAGGGHEDLVITGNGTLSVGKAYVDNTTEHVTKVAYNFGKISTETKDSNGNVIDYKIVIREFPTIFSNIYNNTYSWNWATRAQLNTSLNAVAGGLDYTATTGGVYNIPNMPYSTSIEYGATVTYDLGYIYGVSSRDSKYNANLDAPYTVAPDLASLQIVSAKLVSNSNNLDEYFTATLGTTGAALAPAITLAEKSGSTNPTADVPSTLIITAKDMYNNDVEIRLPMTVKKR